ncbi:hypothetical protein BD779DRAFT_1223919 [Infundibulicybe gibba]|nr:hypothetical protein BD779DRAFT_1223919 [Infundibulicybe gibba]
MPLHIKTHASVLSELQQTHWATNLWHVATATRTTKKRPPNASNRPAIAPVLEPSSRYRPRSIKLLYVFPTSPLFTPE